MKRIVSTFITIIWMLVIFLLSSMNGIDSHSESVSGIESTITKTYSVTDKVGITNNESKNMDNISNLSKKLNYPIRKCLHVFEYFILTLLLFNMFYQYGLSYKKMAIYSIVICIAYACTDEIHQSFTGRTSRFMDVLIDSIGSFIAMLLSIMRNKRIKKKLLIKS